MNCVSKIVHSKALIFLFFALLEVPCPTHSQRPGFKPYKNQLNRRFWWSSSAPLTKALNDLTPEIIPDIELILRHVERVEDTVLSLLPRRRVTKPSDAVRLCSPGISRAWRNSLKNQYGNIGLIIPSRNCGAEVSGVVLEAGIQAGYTLDDLYNAIFNRGVAAQRRMREIASRVIDNFTNPSFPFNFTFDTSSVRCTLSPACFGRQGEHYFTAMSIHSAGIHDFVVDGQQMSIREFVRLVNGKLGGNPKLWLPVYDDGTVERVIRNDTTTYIQRWSTNPNPSCFREVPLGQNPALLEAIDKADFSAQQAEDALTSSNIAILVLPLSLNVVPLALFATVDTKKMLIYMLMSDVLTVIPLAIKGLEMMIIGQDRFRSVKTWISSEGIGNGTRPNSVAGEIFAAECRVRDEVYDAGLILVVVSFVFLVIGVAGEILAWRYERRLWMKKDWSLVQPSLPVGDYYAGLAIRRPQKSSGSERFNDFVDMGKEGQERSSEDEETWK